MICLTGDLHHMSLGTGNQRHCDITEIQVAQRYLALLEEANVKVTFFVSGKAFLEEWSDLKSICRHPLVEIAGHNYSCFTPVWWHRMWNKVIGSYNGPAWYQRYDANKTIRMIRRYTDRSIQCWRNHMYMHGPHTERVLAQCGIKICSDGVKADSNGLSFHSEGIYNFPINILPDHEHLYHAERTPEWVDWWVKRYHWSDDFGAASYHVEEWTQKVLQGLEEHEQKGVVSNMIVHPITLYLCDRFVQFEKILKFLGNHETIHMSEMLQKGGTQ